MQFNRKCIKTELLLKEDIFCNEWPTVANATGIMQINEDKRQFISKEVKH